MRFHIVKLIKMYQIIASLLQVFIKAFKAGCGFEGKLALRF